MNNEEWKKKNSKSKLELYETKIKCFYYFLNNQLQKCVP